MFSRLESLFVMSPSASAEKACAQEAGRRNLRLDRLNDATGCYRNALSLDPDYAYACVALGFALNEQKQYDEAGQLSATCGVA